MCVYIYIISTRIVVENILMKRWLIRLLLVKQFHI